MARCVIGDLLSWCATEVGIETCFITAGPEELAWIHNGRGNLFCGRPVFRCDKCGMFSSHHHRASWVDGNDRLSAFVEWQEDAAVRVDVAPTLLQVSAVPCRH